jgi:uncharacterized protein YcbX
MTPRLAGIRIFPIKALDALVLNECALLPGGALAGDRRPAHVALSAPDRPERRFALDGDLAPLEAWLSDALGQPIRLGRDDAGGFPDDRKASGPTVVSSASLEEVARWFPEVGAESIRRRFRANLEIGGVPPFWEDRLFGAAGTTVPFRVGEATLAGTNPCARCAVPPRDPDTGEILGGFQKRFSDRRRASLPAWADASRFDHFYRFTVNTVAPGQGVRMLCVGDPVTVA